MKQKIYTLLVLSFLLCTSSLLAVKADTTKEMSKTIETTNAAETTTKETTTVSKQVKTVNKTIKVNQTYKLKKLLKISNASIKHYDFSISNSKVASVSASGIVKGLKKGSATITLTSKTDKSVFARVRIKVKNRYSKSDLRLMASIIYSEAGNESYAGQKAVGIVIMNRIKSKDFPNTLKGVLYQSGQFSPTRNGSLNRSLARYDRGEMSRKSIKAARATLNCDKYVTINKKSIDMSNCLFFSGYVSGHKLQIGSHQFK